MESEKIKRISQRATDSEKRIEAKLVRWVESVGGIALKFHSNTTAGYPDRILIMPNGITAWVEVKSKGDKPRKIQELRIAKLRRLGHTALIIDSVEGIQELQELLPPWNTDHTTTR